MTLTQVAQIFRKGVWVLAGLLGFYILSITLIIPLGTAGFRVLFPEKNPANPMYGKLDSLKFIEKSILNDKTTITYSLETKSGKLPAFPVLAPIFKYKDVTFSLQAGPRAQDEAAFLGFTDDELTTDLKGSVFGWKSKVTGGTLKINKDTRAITLNTNLIGLSNSYPADSRLTEAASIDLATKLLQNLGRFEDTSYQSGTKTVELGKFVNEKLTRANSVRETQIARVDFFRSIAKVPILGPDPYKGNISVWVKTPKEEKSEFNTPEMQVYSYDIESANTNASYPIVPIQDVWAEVAKGNGIIAGVQPKDYNPFETYQPVRIDKIIINNVYVAFYDYIEPQKYLQPIYVFEGNYTSTTGGGGDVTLYYPAVDSQYINSSQQ